MVNVENIQTAELRYCHNCNVSLGLMKEDVIRLQSAIEYLNAAKNQNTGEKL